MNLLEEVMTAAEATEKWQMNPRTVQQSCTGYKGEKPRFTEDEARKAGRMAGNQGGNGKSIWSGTAA